MGRDWRPTEDAVAVARLKEAGAVVLGKTNLATAIADWQSFNVIYGTNKQSLGSRPNSGRLFRWFGSSIGRRIRTVGNSDRISAARFEYPRTFVACFSHKTQLRSGCRSAGHAPPRLTGTADRPYERARRLRADGTEPPADLASALDVLAGPDEYQAGALSHVSSTSASCRFAELPCPRG